MLIIRLIFSFTSLLAIGMLLINLVAFMLWQRMSFQQALGSARSLLPHIEDKVINEQKGFSGSLSEISLGAQSVGVLQFRGSKPVFRFTLKSPHNTLLSSILIEAGEKGREVSYSPAGIWSIFQAKKQFLFLAKPVATDNETTRAVGLVVPLESMYKQLLQAEKVILIYMLINLLLLSILSFFRLRAQVIKPIERLVVRANRYAEDNMELFTLSGSGNEFSGLASSLNSLVGRIEEDKKSLKATVDQLAEANQKLAENQQEMIRAEKMVVTGRLTAGLAHEIGNPLGVVTGYLELLKKQTIHWDEKLDYIKRSEAELARVDRLIGQLKSSSTQPFLDQKLLHVHSVIDAVVILVAQSKENRQITFSKHFNAKNDVVYACADAMKQVLLNCLFNAVDAVKDSANNSEGLVEVTTINEEKQGEDFLLIAVSDNGIGLPKEKLESVFDPFFTTKPPGEGTGLGLTVSLSLIESFGGKMVFESKESEGTVMSIYVPQAEGNNFAETVFSEANQNHAS